MDSGDGSGALRLRSNENSGRAAARALSGRDNARAVPGNRRDHERGMFRSASRRGP